MNVACVTPYSPEPPSDPEWVGYRSVGGLLAQALRREEWNPSCIGGFPERGRLWRGARQAAHNLVARRRYLRFVEPGILQGYAHALGDRLRGRDIGCIISHGWLATAFLQTDIPVVVHNDAPLVRMVDYYAYYSGLTAGTVQRIRAVERRALQQAVCAVYASQWAADGVREAYPECAEKVYTVPYGPALPDELLPADTDELIDERLRHECCELLFFGVDWERKGGPLAVEIVRRLNRSGLRSRLTVVGCTPSLSRSDAEYVAVHGFLDAHNRRDANRLAQLIGRSRFLLLPVRAEAFGLVFAEASAFGVPSLATATGGVPDAVRDGMNGMLFAPDADADRYCDAILRLVGDRERYRELARSSRREYCTRLNWNSIGKEWTAILRERVPVAVPNV